MHKEKLGGERRDSDIGHIGNMSYVSARKVVGKEVIMLVGRTATIEFEVAPCGFFAKIGQFGEVFTTNCN